MTTIRSTDRLTDAEVADVLALATTAEQSDGVYPLSEDVVLRVRNGGGRHLMSFADAVLAGYAFVDADGAGELVVAPPFRRQGHGTALLTAAGDGPLAFWVHGDEPGARTFAEKN